MNNRLDSVKTTTALIACFEALHIIGFVVANVYWPQQFLREQPFSSLDAISDMDTIDRQRQEVNMAKERSERIRKIKLTQKQKMEKNKHLGQDFVF